MDPTHIMQRCAVRSSVLACKYQEVEAAFVAEVSTRFWAKVPQTKNKRLFESILRKNLQMIASTSRLNILIEQMSHLDWNLEQILATSPQEDWEFLSLEAQETKEDLFRLTLQYKRDKQIAFLRDMEETDFNTLLKNM